MIQLEGKILVGLDEWMMRVGHLKVLCEVADEVGQSSRRIVSEARRRLTAPLVIQTENEADVAEYLYEKRLCPRAPSSAGDVAEAEFRYPHISVERVASGQYRLITSDTPSAPSTIWWQDSCLADSRVPSKVGAITVDARAGSKTGLSHVADWAAFLDLISSVGELSFVAKLLVRLPKVGGSSLERNPYILKGDKIPLAYACLSEDFDVFSRLLPRLFKAGSPLKKSKARQLFATTLDEMAQEASAASYLPSTSRFKVFEQARELDKAAKRSRSLPGETSTAWHRVSSRLETYVDLGFLSKDCRDRSERFAYTYYPSAGFDRTVASLEHAKDCEDWLDNYLVHALYGDDNAQNSLIGPDELHDLLLPVIDSLNQPTTVYSISVLSQAIAWQKAEQGCVVSLGVARTSLEDFARHRPEVARLARGHRGDRAEFISIEANWLHRGKANAN